MIQPFWRYISKSYSLCPSLLIPDLVPRFLERDEAAKQTLALEYTFGRKTNQNLVKVNI